MSIAGNFSIRVRAAAILALMVVLATCAGAAHANPANGDGAAAVKRAVTVADAIEMTEIGDPSAVSKGGNVVQFSPDGSKFAFVTQKGNLKNDTVEFSLMVFRTADAFTSAQPEVIATMASSSNRPAISDVQWLSDNKTIVFLGEQPEETPQIYTVSTQTKKLEKLTTQPTPILSYSMSEQGGNFIYVAQASPLPVLSDEMRQHGFFVTSQFWDDLYKSGSPIDTRYEIYVKTPEIKTARRVGGVLDLLWSALKAGLSISPNGQYALLRAPTRVPPVAWDEYQYKSASDRVPSAGACRGGDVHRCPEQLLVVNLEKGTVEPLLNAPRVDKAAGFALAAWTRESTVLLVNALLPLDSVQGEERSRRLNHVYAAEVTIPERKILKISERQEPYPAVFTESSAARDRIVVKTGVAALGRPIEFRKEASGWKITEMDEASLEPDDRLSVTLDQDINTPPKLMANDRKTKRKAVVLDLNPQFSQLTLGRVEIFPWKTREGKFGEGALYYPPDYVRGKKYPLVIQTHDERRERFWIAGPYTTAYAAQPLANRGFLVLQMGIADIYEKASVDEIYRIISTSQEGPYETALFEAAMDELDQRGLIDRNRVGLSGFSRTAYHTLYALTHSSYHFAAAVAADGVNFGYVDCIYYVENGLCERMNGGGPPYGDSLSRWAKAAPTFRLDKIQAPLLLQAITAPLGEWEIFSGLRWLKKPVELLNFYPEGTHELVRPQQRLFSQGSVVDWYCFWLKGEEDPDPAKAEQYKRWRELRKLQQENDAKDRATKEKPATVN